MDVLYRNKPLNALPHLIASLKNEIPEVGLSRTAISLDTSAFLRITRLSRKDDVLDYLSEKHPAPLIIPGQAIQEFWNNKNNVSETLVVNLKNKYDALRKESEKARIVLGSDMDIVTQSLEKVVELYGEIHDPRATADIVAMLESLNKKAVVPYAARDLYAEIAAHRKSTRTPPGFKDDGDGDFYIWVDTLIGLLSTPRQTYDKIVIVSNDEKLDWSRNGTPHPILAAEVNALFNCPFELWKPDRLEAAVVQWLELEN